ncbi:MAG TPA: OadG family protein [Termitinemataceae bacterium]|nr:OadG family protein [Termitinemataceae bacterium]HOM22622.1 OadG family protein [Termitinemataceae bacterium]HPP99461.1 OadG family protein [Termitinemataceae bacterium]
MTILEMFEQSGILTLLGMGVVFGFLVILVLFMNLVAWIIRLLGWDKDEQESNGSTAAGAAASAAGGAAVVAAITAAVNEYRKTHQ